MGKLKHQPTLRRTPDTCLTCLEVKAALLASQQNWSMAARNWPRLGCWSPPWPVRTPARECPCLPLTYLSLLARIPVPRAFWAWGLESSSATRAKASVMRSIRCCPTWPVSHTTWRLSCVSIHPQRLIRPLPPSSFQPLTFSLKSLLSLCQRRRRLLSPSSQNGLQPQARRALFRRKGQACAEEAANAGTGRTWQMLKLQQQQH